MGEEGRAYKPWNQRRGCNDNAKLPLRQVGH